MKKSHFRYWELALLLALAVTILWGAASLGQQEELGRKVIRLHVIANSDSPEDQALKLRVRDRVLARAQEILEQSADMEQAEQALTAALPELTREARETLAAEGCAQPVQARLEPAEFPTKDYDGFSLPAGKYLALRVIIGQGAGQNWWCVVFPPLCTAAACQWQAAGRAAGLEEADLSLLAEEAPGPVGVAVVNAAPVAGEIRGRIHLVLGAGQSPCPYAAAIGEGPAMLRRPAGGSLPGVGAKCMCGG